MNSKGQKTWSFIGLFIIALVVSIPFYVAEVHAASLTITKSHGDKNLKGYIDGDGDTWTVEALISGAGNGTIDPKQVKMNVKGNEDSFNSCSGGTLGTVCKYVSPLKDGISSGVYDYSVFYYFADGLGNNQTISGADKIKVDGSTLSNGFTKALQINLKSVKQNPVNQGLLLDFSVEDKDKSYCSGLKKIEIIDSVAGVLKTIQNFSESCKYDFRSETISSGYLALNMTGEGKRWIKIKAEDNLGHTYTTGATSFYSDFVKPVIGKTSLKLNDFGTYIGQFNAKTDITINVTEVGGLAKVTANSSQAKIEGAAATCVADSKVVGAYICTWKNIQVTPKSTISLQVEAVDNMGNTAVQTVSTSLNVDSSNPKASYFGTPRTYQKVSMVSGKKGVMNQIILRITEKGAGIAAKDLVAGLSGLDGQSGQLPSRFNNTTLEAFWDVDYGGGSSDVLVGMAKFQDKVGNYDSKNLPQMKVVVDDSGPVIENLEIYGASSAATKKNFIQSGDKVTLEFKVKEGNGLLFLVNLNDLVKDAKTKYPESKVKKVYPEMDIPGYSKQIDYEGWAVFTEQDCDGINGSWSCKLETKEIKSGPDSAVSLEVEVYDTAGNPATWSRDPKNIKSGRKGDYVLDLLGVTNEEKPDYWEVSAVSTYGIDDFIDIDTTKQISGRMAMKINLKTDSRAEVAKIDLVSCTPEAGFSANSREVLFENLGSGTTTTPSPVLIIEMTPFDSKSYLKVGETKEDFETAYVTYTCKLNIFSKIGKAALKNAEVQEVILKVPFGFTGFGSLDENMKKKIDDAKAEYYDDTEWIEVTNKVLDWIRYVGRIINVIQQLIGLYDIISSFMNETASNTQKTGVAAGIAVLKGTCFTLQTSEHSFLKYIRYLQIPIQILSCEPGGSIIQAEAGATSDRPTTSGAKAPAAAGGAITLPVVGQAGQQIQSSGLESALGENNWYFAYQRYILEAYNHITLREYLKIPATSLYDNFYVSIIGLCVPGVIYNLQKLREVHCRKIVCLQKEVPQGIATVSSCDNLFELQECQFFTGPFLELLPFGLWDTIGQALKGVFQSPVGLISGLSELLACAAGCWVDHGSVQMIPCKAIKFINKILDIVNTIVGLVKNRPDVSGAPYCGMVEDLEKEAEKTTKSTKAATQTSTTSGTATAPTTSTSKTPSARTPTSGTAPTTSKSAASTTSKTATPASIGGTK